MQLARVHGPPNTVIVTADERLALLVRKCRSTMSAGVRSKLGLDECERIVGLPYEPATFPNVVDLARDPRANAEDFVGCALPK